MPTRYPSSLRDEQIKLTEIKRIINGEIEPYCSFCGKHKDKVTLLIRATKATICDECVLTCNELLFDRLKKQDEAEFKAVEGGEG